jgi:hypothetical protein
MNWWSMDKCERYLLIAFILSILNLLAVIS